MTDLDLEHSLQNALRENDEETHANAQKRKRDLESADATGRVHKRVSPNHSGLKTSDIHQQDNGVEALQDYQPIHHQHHDPNGAEHASSTAAAALAGIYPTMTIPQPTDVSFASQGSGDQNQDSFMDTSQQGNDSFLENPTPSRTSSKPAVGSEEWHKVRKDNHKEGKKTICSFTEGDQY